MSHVAPTQTPNVVIENPTVRRRLRTVLDIIGGLSFIAGAVDIASADIDIATITGPIAAGYIAARVVFGFAVDNPNTPAKSIPFGDGEGRFE